MLSRYFVSFNIAAMITFGLFFAMQMLISNGEVVLTEENIRHPVKLGKIRPVEERIDRIEPPELLVIDDAPVIPQTNKTPPGTGPVINRIIGPDINERPMSGFPENSLANIDGVQIPIVRPAPQYPVRLREKGVEGYVRVQFDITLAGNTENVVAVESSHQGFERNAIKAAQKFKFKPKVVDGEAVRVTGVFNRIDFKLQD
tara:strand:+ start:116791 stop:117393 length:603 start_codon:yes stop_codon:yes gene_type:complete